MSSCRCTRRGTTATVEPWNVPITHSLPLGHCPSPTAHLSVTARLSVTAASQSSLPPPWPLLELHRNGIVHLDASVPSPCPSAIPPCCFVEQSLATHSWAGSVLGTDPSCCGGSLGGGQGCWHILGVISKAAVNILVHTVVWNEFDVS